MMMKKSSILAAASAALLLAIPQSAISQLFASGSSLPVGSAVQQGGTIVGKVRFLETPPKTERLRIDRDNETCGLRKFSKEFIISEDTKGLKNVVLVVVGVPTTTAPAGLANPRLTQEKCEYVPHVQTAVVGQSLEIKNSDAILHNIHAYDEKRGTIFNWAQPIQNQENKRKLKEEGVMSVRCDVHGWMQAYVVVSPHPFAAVTGDDGSFRIEGVPPGSYKLRAWHEGMGQFDKDVVVQSGSEATVNFDVGK